MKRTVAAVIAVIVLAASCACALRENPSAKAAAERFLKACYQIESYDMVEAVDTIHNKARNNPELYMVQKSAGLAGYTDEINAELTEVLLRDINGYITENAGKALIANRIPYSVVQTAKELGFTTEIGALTFTEHGMKENAKSFGFTAQIKITKADGTVKTQELTGTVTMVLEDDKWLVDYYRETKRLDVGELK